MKILNRNIKWLYLCHCPLPSFKTLNQLSLVSHWRWTSINRRAKEGEIEELRRKVWLHAVTCCDFHQDWTTKQELVEQFPLFCAI